MSLVVVLELSDESNDRRGDQVEEEEDGGRGGVDSSEEGRRTAGKSGPGK